MYVCVCVCMYVCMYVCMLHTNECVTFDRSIESERENEREREIYVVICR